MLPIYTLKFDGSCWPNPGGRAGYGYILETPSVTIKESKEILGIETSNNLAEYVALYEGLKAFTVDYENEKCTLNIIGDSQFVINQMTDKWKIRSKDKPFYEYAIKSRELVKILRKKGIEVIFTWVRREQNQDCDDLSKKHLEAK